MKQLKYRAAIRQRKPISDDEDSGVAMTLINTRNQILQARPGSQSEGQKDPSCVCELWIRGSPVLGAQEQTDAVRPTLQVINKTQRST